MIIPIDYPWVLAAGLGMTFQGFVQAINVSRSRKQIFPKEFMEKIYGKEHRAQIKEEIPAGGYPDTGSGFYSNKLSYKDWYNFNVLQRVHLNYMEQLPMAMIALAAAGLYRPRAAAALGAVYIIAK